MDVKNKYRILLTDDEPDILEILSYNLRNEGYLVETANNGLECLNKVQTFKPNMVLLDIMMPKLDGIETCRQIRDSEEILDVIIVFLTARTEDYSQLAGYEAGANDYITKPIKPRLFVAKINALTAMHAPINIDSPRIKLKSITIDKNQYQVIVDQNIFPLPKKEFELLDLLASKPGRVFRREEILSIVWNDPTLIASRTIDVHIRKLREKIGNKFFKTIKGVGYKFVDYPD
ncbi:MAG: response regulator transcription factor [Bacteroidia bacterium]|nr:response regulator transcription factor [Bacteroidia bacterium]